MEVQKQRQRLVQVQKQRGKYNGESEIHAGSLRCGGKSAASGRDDDVFIYRDRVDQTTAKAKAI